MTAEDDGDDKVSRLGVRFKEPPKEEPILKVVNTWELDRCNHQYFFRDGGIVNVTYEIREGETEVECGLCRTKLDPMWVLGRLALKESGWNHARASYQEEMARLRERSRTKCEHCGKLTRISRR